MDQRSPEWYQARLGKATASKFNDIMAQTAGGRATAGWKNYMAELVTERLTGVPAESYTSAPMQWGIDNEPLARLLYTLRSGKSAIECGFFEHETISAGASPDGLIGEDGILEIKCPNTATHIETLKTGQVPKQYYAQVQGQMWITGRKWADFVSFDPRLPDNAKLIIVPMARDQEYVQRLENKIIQFLLDVEAEVEFVKNYGRETNEKQPVRSGS